MLCILMQSDYKLALLSNYTIDALREGGAGCETRVRLTPAG